MGGKWKSTVDKDVFVWRVLGFYYAAPWQEAGRSTADVETRKVQQMIPTSAPLLSVPTLNCFSIVCCFFFKKFKKNSERATQTTNACPGQVYSVLHRQPAGYYSPR